jgi:uncharacterized membrane protein YeiH
MTAGPRKHREETDSRAIRSGMTSSYYVEMAGSAVFAISGVLAVTRRGLDIVGAVMLGIVTAIGGGTVRDLVIGIRPFWIADFNYVWAACAGALAAFWIGWLFRTALKGVLYLDALGAALFAIAAANKVLLLTGSAPVAVVMGVLTGIGGGLIRDVLAGRPTLLMGRDIYATPIMIGCASFVLLRAFVPTFAYADVAGMVLIFTGRALAIHQHLQMPVWLTAQDAESAL